MMEEKRMEYRWPKQCPERRQSSCSEETTIQTSGRKLSGRKMSGCEKGKGKRRDSGCLCMGKFGAGGWHLYL